MGDVVQTFPSSDTGKGRAVLLLLLLRPALISAIADFNGHMVDSIPRSTPGKTTAAAIPSNIPAVVLVTFMILSISVSESIVKSFLF